MQGLCDSSCPYHIFVIADEVGPRCEIFHTCEVSIIKRWDGDALG